MKTLETLEKGGKNPGKFRYGYQRSESTRTVARPEPPPPVGPEGPRRPGDRERPASAASGVQRRPREIARPERAGAAGLIR
jgi:hypothetical protein